ncbi:MAG: hypothetical protein WBB67_06295 [bacterium]
MPTFGFRIRFILPENKRINCSQNSIEIELPSKHKIQLSAYQSNIAIKDSKNLILKGSGLKTKEEARNIGEKLKNSIMLTSAILQIGVDIGEDKADFTIGRFLKEKAEKSGIRLMEDIHGMCVSPEDMPVQWVLSELNATISTSYDKFVKTLTESIILVPEKFDERQYLSLELYNASYFESSLPAQFLTLVSAVECLAKREQKETDVINHIEKLISYTRDSYTGPEKENLISRLGGLKKDSISSSCNKIVKHYLGRESMEYFCYCYGIRSKILHEGIPPTGIELGADAAKLNKLVSQLILKIIEYSTKT